MVLMLGGSHIRKKIDDRRLVIKPVVSNWIATARWKHSEQNVRNVCIRNRGRRRDTETAVFMWFGVAVGILCRHERRNADVTMTLRGLCPSAMTRGSWQDGFRP